MPDYQIYRFDDRGYVVAFAGEVTSATDEQAIERARQYGVAIEVWDGARFVKRLDSKE